MLDVNAEAEARNPRLRWAAARISRFDCQKRMDGMS